MDSERGRPTRPSSTQMWEDSESPRPRDRKHDRDKDREPRDVRDRANTPSDRRSPEHTPNDRYKRRDRSRSPHERGSRRSENTRYRSRSPFRREERDRDRGARTEKDRSDRDGDDFRGRNPPKGPRGGGGHRKPDPRADRPVKAPEKGKPGIKGDAETHDVEMDVRPEGLDDETWEMMKIMGFAGFKSTKNTKVPGNDKNYGVRKDKRMEARQYMNRTGGFNRPLSPSR